MKKRKPMPKWPKIIWKALGFIYLPVYATFWLLLRVVRIMLAIAYCGLLEFRKAKDIIKYMFLPYDR